MVAVTNLYDRLNAPARQIAGARGRRSLSPRWWAGCCWAASSGWRAPAAGALLVAPAGRRLTAR
ncbi:hypothetical protein ACFQ0B_48290 [Nonomuraea thailandensis]